VSLEQRIAMRAFAMYLYNASGVRFAEDIFPGRHPNYMDEYARAWAASPSAAIGKLDDGNMRKLFEIIAERYGDAATQMEVGQ